MASSQQPRRENAETAAGQQPLRVVRADKSVPAVGYVVPHSSNSSPNSGGSRSSACTDSEVRGEDYQMEYRSGSLMDTHIPAVSHTPHVRVVESDTQYAYDNVGLLWPDVVDPYHRAHELELRIADTAVHF